MSPRQSLYYGLTVAVSCSQGHLTLSQTRWKNEEEGAHHLAEGPSTVGRNAMRENQFSPVM